jgi:hypothetical protein
MEVDRVVLVVVVLTVASFETKYHSSSTKLPWAILYTHGQQMK